MNNIHKTIIVLVLLFNTLTLNANTSEEKLQNNILLAENYLWLTLDEGAHTKMFRKTKKYINLSYELVEEIDPSKRDLYVARIKSIQEELESTANVQDETLYGFYPLLKQTTSNFFFLPTKPKIHTLVKNPKYLAVKNSIGASAKILRQLHQRHVFINSIPYDPEAEEVAFHVFNNTDKLFPRLKEEVVTALQDKKYIQDYKENNINSEVINRLLSYVDDQTFYLVTVNRNLTEDDDYYYTISTKNYSSKGVNQLMSTDAFGYAIDESKNWPYILFSHFVLLLIVLAFSMYKEKEISIRQVTFPIIFFIIGRAFPWLAITTLLAFRPDILNHIFYSTWWVLAVGIAIFVLPIIGLKMGIAKLRDYLPVPQVSNKGDLIGISIAAGALSFISIPFFYTISGFWDAIAIFSFLVFSLAILIAGLAMGKISDESHKMDEKNLVFYAFGVAILTATLMHANFEWLFILSIVMIALSIMQMYYYNKNFQLDILDNGLVIEEDEMGGPTDIEITQVDLQKIVRQPLYQKFNYFDAAYDRIKNILQGETSYLVLQGNAGSGKTRTAKILINEIGQDLSAANSRVLFFSATCHRTDGAEVPYKMFHELLDSTFDIDLFGQRVKDEKFDQALTLASTFLMGPIAGFISSAKSSEANSFSKDDILVYVKRKFIELSKQNTLIIFVDDIQWVDKASLELLKYLKDELSVLNEKILFIFTSRDSAEAKHVLEEVHLVDSIQLVGNIDKNEQLQLLEKSFYLSRKASSWLIEWMNEKGSEFIYPYNLIDTVGNLNRINAFEAKEYHFDMVHDFNYAQPPIPDNTKSEIRNILVEFPDYRELLSLASILGKEFNVSVLAEILDITYADILEKLNDISQNTGLLYDLYEKDDVYQFRSQIVVDALREANVYSTEGPSSNDVPQNIRHYHALVAKAYEERYEHIEDQGMVFKIANHYYSAGRFYVAKAGRYSILAAKECRRLFEYKQAKNYLQRANELASLTKDISVDEIRYIELLLACDLSHIKGIKADEVARDGTNYLEEHLDCADELKIAVVRSCYDAGAQNSSQEWFAKAVIAAEEYLLISDQLETAAEGHHFIGISLNPREADNKELMQSHLEKALELTESANKNTYAKIANSLAEFLSYGSDEDKKRASDLFGLSLDIKENADIKDLPGIARTYGGLGRLYFFSKPSELTLAKEYFIKDLEIAEEINDYRGISQMNSFLGQCSIKENNYNEAVAYFLASIEQKNNPFDVHASYTGLFEALVALDDKDQTIIEIDNYLKVIEQYGIPRADFLVASLKSSLEKHLDISNCQTILEKLNNKMER